MQIIYYSKEHQIYKAKKRDEHDEHEGMRGRTAFAYKWRTG